MATTQKKKLNKADFTFAAKDGETLVKKPGDIAGNQFMIKDLKNCIVQVLDHSAQVSSNCESLCF